MIKKIEDIKSNKRRTLIKKDLDDQLYDSILNRVGTEKKDQLLDDCTYIIYEEEDTGILVNLYSVCLQIYAFFQYWYNTEKDQSQRIRIGNVIVTILNFSYYNVIFNGYKLSFSYLMEIYEMDPDDNETNNAILFFSSFPDFPSEYFTYDIQNEVYNKLNAVPNLKLDYKSTLERWRNKR